MCVVTGARQYSMDLPQGDLEIPCHYIFKTNNQTESDKTRKLLETVLEIMIEPTTSGDKPTKLKVQNPEQAADTSTSKEKFAVTTPVHEDFPATSYSTDLQIQCSHCSTDPIPVVTIDEETNNEQPPKKRKLSNSDIERIIMGEELCDANINLVQRLLRVQFPELGGLRSTLLQQKEAPIPERKENMLEIVHRGSQHHWVVVTTIGSKRDAGELLVYDSIFKNVDRETRKNICYIFQLLPVSNVKVVKTKKQIQ